MIADQLSKLVSQNGFTKNAWPIADAIESIQSIKESQAEILNRLARIEAALQMMSARIPQPAGISWPVDAFGNPAPYSFG